LEDLLASIVPLQLRNGINPQAMYKTGLVSGVVDAFELPK
jgi:hypothetical protein